MTRKDFQLIADTIKTIGETGMYSGDVQTVGDYFATALASTNDIFDREKFLKACEIK